LVAPAIVDVKNVAELPSQILVVDRIGEAALGKPESGVK
jgi:hypothetical protein